MRRATDDAAVAALFSARIGETDEFYASITPAGTEPGEALVMRRALAGMLWGKQHYDFDLDLWLEEHQVHPLREGDRGRDVRNRSWFHMVNDDVISMPDTWEYPWYASWDLAFHTVALAMVDIDDAKAQLELMLRELYMHPSGQLPAYEWNFSDVNPPVHAWATLLVYETELEQRGEGDVPWLKRAFHKLLVNFTWWLNRKDPSGRNVFEGGFLGLDNIGVFDRSAPLPTGGRLEQADGTAWMAFYAQCMLGIALELTNHDDLYADMALKFAEHFAFIAAAMDRIGENRDELWDEEDGFYYDVLRLPDGQATRLKVRSMVGLLPLCATTILPSGAGVGNDLVERVRRRIEAMPELLATIHDPGRVGVDGRRMLAVLDETKLRRVLARMLDETEFLGPHGIRSLSRRHAEDPYRVDVHGQTYEVRYLPAESDSGMFGGNSNWRGPVWFPVNYLLLRGLLHLYAFYGDDFTVECPTGSGVQRTLFEVAEEIGRRLTSIFLPDDNGRRPVFGATERFQSDPAWNDMLLFYEYFDGDDGSGPGGESPDRVDRPGGADHPGEGISAPRGRAGRRARRQPRLPGPREDEVSEAGGRGTWPPASNGWTFLEDPVRDLGRGQHELLELVVDLEQRQVGTRHLQRRAVLVDVAAEDVDPLVGELLVGDAVEQVELADRRAPQPVDHQRHLVT